MKRATMLLMLIAAVVVGSTSVALTAPASTTGQTQASPAGSVSAAATDTVEPTKLTLQGSFNVIAGTWVRVTGKLTASSTGEPLVGKRVHIESGGGSVASTLTGDQGTYAVSLYFNHRWGPLNARFDGDGVYAATTSSVSATPTVYIKMSKPRPSNFVERGVKGKPFYVDVMTLPICRGIVKMDLYKMDAARRWKLYKGSMAMDKVHLHDIGWTRFRRNGFCLPAGTYMFVAIYDGSDFPKSATYSYGFIR
jgi:hypothetical protein